MSAFDRASCDDHTMVYRPPRRLDSLRQRLPDRRTRRLRRLGRERFWRWRRAWIDARTRAAQFRSSGRNFYDESRQNGSSMGQLVVGALGTVCGALFVVAVVELLAIWLGNHSFVGRHHEWWYRIVRPIGSGEYGTFVAAAVGAQAVFLALFFTTVGVIASTAYANVPADIRELFVRERSSRIYAYTVVWGLVFGVALLAAPLFRYQPHATTVGIFTLLTLFAVITLLRLGTDLFRFFDLSSLAVNLPRQFLRSAQAVSGTRSSDLPAEQQTFYRQGHRVLDRYRQLVVLLRARQGTDHRASVRLLRQLLGIWRIYSQLKTAIPTESLWFDRTASHTNWLVAGPERLRPALAAEASLPAERAPDALWVERQLQARMSELLGNMLGGSGWQSAIAVIDEATALAGELASHFLVSEAVLLARTTSAELDNSLASAFLQDGASARELEIFRITAIERRALSLTAVWLGFVRGASEIQAVDLRRHLDTAVASSNAPYRFGAPRSFLATLEQVASGIAFEERTEGRRVTSSWWVHHICARSLTVAVIDAANEMITEVESTVVARAESDEFSKEPKTRATLVFAGLELCNKMRTFLPNIRSALDELATLRNSAAGDGDWPPDDLAYNKPPIYSGRLLKVLATIIPELPTDGHDNSMPDFFGQSYKRLFDATFRALLRGDAELAEPLFDAVLWSTDSVRARLLTDLTDQTEHLRSIYVAEPVRNLMELSGYALLLQELDGTGIWPHVKEKWEQMLADGHGKDLVPWLLRLLDSQGHLEGITAGALERTQRRIDLNEMLRERGIIGHSPYFNPFGSSPEPASGQSPIVTVFAPDSVGDFDELTDLFAAEYLIDRPEASGVQIKGGVDRVRRSIERERARTDPDGEGDEDTGEDIDE